MKVTVPHAACSPYSSRLVHSSNFCENISNHSNSIAIEHFDTGLHVFKYSQRAKLEAEKNTLYPTFNAADRGSIGRNGPLFGLTMANVERQPLATSRYI